MQTIDRNKASVFRFALPYGLAAGISYVLLFLLFSLVGLGDNPTLRVINFIILIPVVFFAIKKYKNFTDGGMNYLEGLGVGAIVSAVSFGILSVFVLVYLSLINPGFYNELVQNTQVGRYLTPSSASIWIFSEGITAGPIITFILMQYFKQNRYH